MDPYPKFFKDAAELRGVYDTTAADAEAIAALLRSQNAHRVLDVPCGFGRLAGPLHEVGFDVTGIDLSNDQIGLAQELNPGPTYQIGNMVDPPQEEFDALLNIYTSFGYLENEEADFKCLKAWRSSLRSKGLLVLETLDTERVAAIDDEERHLQRPDGQFYRKTGPLEEYIFTDPHSRIMSINYNLRGQNFTSRTRLYHRGDLVELLDQAGFSEIQTFSSFDLDPAFAASPLVILAKA